MNFNMHSKRMIIPIPLGNAILREEVFIKFRRIMKLVVILLLAFNLTTFGNTYAQITVSFENATLREVLTEIRKQSGYSFIYESEQVNKAHKVSVQMQQASIQEILKIVFKQQPFDYEIKGKSIYISSKKVNSKSSFAEKSASQEVFHGQVVDEEGKPLIKAIIRVVGATQVTDTDQEGKFQFSSLPQNARLQISYLGYATKTVIAESSMLIVLKKSTSSIDEVVLMAYGTTTKKLNTGSIATVTAAEIERQPVSNPLEALYGKVPGLIITSTNGLPGSGFKVQLRGQTSIGLNGNSPTITSNDPLFVIDGVPFATNNGSISSGVYSALEGYSPLSLINPSDIETITVLKDADATAIYGSRGANGVILIQTKRGVAGKMNITANIQSGVSRVTKTTDWMNTQQYVEMRKEAFKNDGVAMTPVNAYDILVWDTTRYTDFNQLIYHNNANFTDAQLSLRGGNNLSTYYVGAGYNYQTTVLSNEFSNKRASLHLSLTNKSSDDRFNMLLTGSYSHSNNHLPNYDLSRYVNLPPNLPELIDEEGKLLWEKDGYAFTNPLADLYKQYYANPKNLNSNLQLSYLLLKGLTLKSSMGYNNIAMSENNLTPLIAIDPTEFNTGGMARFRNSERNSFIVEPQIDYQKQIGGLSFNAMLGATWQTMNSLSTYIDASGYTNDMFLRSAQAAPNKSVQNAQSEYKYIAGFGRLNMVLHDKYILNITGRRDGSSRFGPGNQFGNFGAIGGAYIFSSEEFVKRQLPFLSFGKLRASYGITGNDKIGDYGYMDTYTASITSYREFTMINPTGLSNIHYGWENNKKMETGLELGFFSNRIMLNTMFFRNTSDNQLIHYNLPSQTGGTAVIANFPAVVENKGWEFDLESNIVSKTNFKWNASFNISFPKNTLLAFPDLETSSYNSLIAIGHPLSTYGGYSYSGLNPQTGLIEFFDKDGNLTSNPVAADRNIATLGNTEQKYYGGIQNSFQYHGFSLNMLLEYRNQQGISGMGYLYSVGVYPGTINNAPIAALNRWQQSGDKTNIPAFTTSPGSNFYKNLEINKLSNSKYEDVFFIRFKNISFSYQLPNLIVERIKLNSLQFYVNANNLFVISNYKNGDPETQNIFRTPPLKTMTFGVKTNF